VEQKDILLNHLLSEGIIRGEYFFRLQLNYFYGFIDVDLDYSKSIKNNWFGYHIRLNKIKELKINSDKIPKKSKHYWEQIKVFQIIGNLPHRLYLVGREDYIRIEIGHNELTLHDKCVPIKEFIENSKLIRFKYSVL